MSAAEYVVLFACVAIMGFGIPGPGDASLLAVGTLAGEGRLNVGIVLVVSAVAWMAGSVIGYAVGHHGDAGCWTARDGWKRRRKLRAKGDHVFGRHTFIASVTLPATASGIFRIRFTLFELGAMAAGGFLVGL